jgi:glutathione S-transferase
MPADPAQTAEAKEWVDLAVSLHIKAIKTWVYGTTGGATKKHLEMGHYADIQPDKEVLAFHTKAVDGFTAAEIEAAARCLSKFATG